MRNEYVFHVLSSIGMRDFVTLQVLVFVVVVVVFHRYDRYLNINVLYLSFGQLFLVAISMCFDV